MDHKTLNHTDIEQPLGSVEGSSMSQPAIPYSPPFWLRNGHVQSIWPTLFRRVRLPEPATACLETPDDDFLLLDWYRRGHSRLAILCHGLEGHSRRPYVLGMARALLRDGWDVLAWNCRSCGGVMNRQLRFYHSGATEDLAAVVSHALDDPQYRRIALVGFSMGANLAMVYLGQQGGNLDSRVVGAVGISVPCDLAGSAEKLARSGNRIYMAQFLKELKLKMAAKARRFPGQISVDGFDSLRSFRDFDNRYTAPLHGFRDAEDYWQRCSANRFLDGIRVPALIVNAQDDPFLSSSCYPSTQVENNPLLSLDVTRWGGHVGFVANCGAGDYWSERRAVQFLASVG